MDKQHTIIITLVFLYFVNLFAGIKANPLKKCVTISGDNGAGSGFFCMWQDEVYVVTNNHVIMELENPAIKTISGELVEFDTIYSNYDRDIALIPCDMSKLDKRKNDYFQIEDEILDILPNADVTCYGDSESIGVIVASNGKMLGVGVDKIETDAQFVPGNSGGPLVNNASGKVIGVVSYLSKLSKADWAIGTRFEADSGHAARRFAYRMDNLSLSDFEIFSIEQVTTDIKNYETIKNAIASIERIKSQNRNNETKIQAERILAWTEYPLPWFRWQSTYYLFKCMDFLYSLKDFAYYCSVRGIINDDPETIKGIEFPRLYSRISKEEQFNANFLLFLISRNIVKWNDIYQYGYTPYSGDDKYTSPLHSMILYGTIEELLLFEEEAEIEYQLYNKPQISDDNPYGKSLIGFAIRSSKDSIKKMEHLSQKGCPIKEFSFELNKILQSTDNSICKASFLLANGLDINAVGQADYYCEHILQHRHISRDSDVEFYQFLIGEGANYKFIDSYGRNLITYYALRHSSDSDFRLLSMYIDLGLDVNNQIQMVNNDSIELLNNSIEIYDKEQDKERFRSELNQHVKGNTALHILSTRFSNIDKKPIEGQIEVMEKLIDKGANVNTKNANGDTPLDYAVAQEVRELLLKHGAVSGRWNKK